MKKLKVILVVMVALFFLNTTAQNSEKMTIHLKAGVPVKYNLSDIDSITFTPCGFDTSKCKDYFVDARDGKTYKSVLIDKQCWMAENLNATLYRNGEAISKITDNTAWSSASAAYSSYNNSEDSATIYGRLYNWYAVNDSRNLCPSGWHLPTDAEWTTLTDFLGGAGGSGSKIKETGTLHWTSPNSGATNESGFTGLPGGYRLNNGTYEGINTSGRWWTGTESGPVNAYSRLVTYNGTGVLTSTYFGKSYGYSVRCLMD